MWEYRHVIIFLPRRPLGVTDSLRTYTFTVTMFGMLLGETARGFESGRVPFRATRASASESIAVFGYYSSCRQLIRLVFRPRFCFRLARVQRSTFNVDHLRLNHNSEQGLVECI